MGTIFLDIDGVLFYNNGSFEDSIAGINSVINGAKEKMHEWRRLGYKIILTTARPEGSREITMKQLEEAGLNLWNVLLMEIPSPRILINDKHDGKNMAYAYNIDRNVGIGIIKHRNEL